LVDALNEIKILDPRITGKKLTSTVSFSPELSKYLKTDTLTVEYDSEITAEESLLNIPITAVVLPLAWLTEADVYVKVLDKSFKGNMDELQRYFKKMYPSLPCKTEIVADELIENTVGHLPSDRRTGLLFSGGIDSSYSLLCNLEKRPWLVMLWGSDNFAYPGRRNHWEKAIDVYRKQSQSLGLELMVVKTNVSQVLYDQKIGHDFHRILYNLPLRRALNHSMVLLPLAAPLSMGRFNSLLIASSGDSSFDYIKERYASGPEADEKIAWADLKVTQDGQVYRDVKIREIGKHLDKGLTLRVCLRTSEEAAVKHGLLNDCSCEKCYRTIMNLIQEGIDPNLCGFKVDESTFKDMRRFMETEFIPHYNYYWGKIIQEIPENIDVDMYGSKEFQEYLRGYRLPEPKEPGLEKDIYYNLPFGLADMLQKYIYNTLKIRIHST